MIPVLEIGGTHVTAALVDGELSVVVPGTVRRSDLDAGGHAEAILATLITTGRSLGAAHRTWGVAIPGPFDYERGVGLFEGVGKFDALRDVDVRGALVQGLAAEDIAFVNDADAFLLGEWSAGAAAGHRRAMGITLGTGIGSAFLADGRMVDRGPDVPPGGRVHLLTIDDRPLEETVSRRAMLARYRDRTTENREAGMAGHDLDIHDLATLARNGDAVAREAFVAPMTALGAALNPWIVRFGASIVVVGGAMSRSWDLIEPPLRTHISAGVDVVLAARPDDAGLIGSARCASARQHEPRAGHTGGAQ